MSDFLGRMAARAVGSTAAAQPRVPGLFERPATAGAEVLEIVDEVVAARVAPPPAPAEAATRAARGVAPSPVEAPPPGREAAAAAAAEPRAPQATSAAPAPPRFEQPQRAAEPNAPTMDVVPEVAAAARATEAPPDLVTTGPVVAAEPALAAAPETVPAPTAAVAHRAGPAVRVHIGRLEVRANLQEAVREQPRREISRPDGLSLADYLRGRREATG